MENVMQIGQGVECDELTGWLAVVMRVSKEEKAVGCLTHYGVVFAQA